MKNPSCQAQSFTTRYKPGRMAAGLRGSPLAWRYTAADVALLAEVDHAMGTLSGPAIVCVLRRQCDVFGDARFTCLGSISVAHLYSLRVSAGYRQQRVDGFEKLFSQSVLFQQMAS